jgi:hypothetical protein
MSKQECVYADDIVLLARNITEFLEMLITLLEIGIKYALYINEDKIKYMKMTATPSDKLPK